MLSTVYTIGHGTKSATEISSICKNNNINLLVDVRSKPFSKYNPSCNKNMFEKESIPDRFKYIWMPALGGLYPEDYSHHGKELKKLIQDYSNYTICIMCSESDYKNCHRYSSLTKELMQMNINVVHLDNKSGRPIKDQKTLL